MFPSFPSISDHTLGKDEREGFRYFLAEKSELVYNVYITRKFPLGGWGYPVVTG